MTLGQTLILDGPLSGTLELGSDVDGRWTAGDTVETRETSSSVSLAAGADLGGDGEPDLLLLDGYAHGNTGVAFVLEAAR